MEGTSLDEVLGKFSVFGRYHIQLMFFGIMAFASNAIFAVNFVFTVEATEYRCLDEAFANNSCGSVDGPRCTVWEYDNPYSFVAEFELACQEWKQALVGTVHSFGYMVGLLIIGPLSDRIGRKKMLIVTGVVGAACGVARSFTYSYWLYIALEFFEAVLGDTCSPATILSLEFVSAKHRVVFFYLCQLGVMGGRIMYSFIAWGVPYWRNLLQTIYFPGFLFITYSFLIDESPRWLLAKGKEKEVEAVIKKMARKNKITIDRGALNKLVVAEDTNETRMSLIGLLKMTFKSRTLLKRCIVCIIWWISSTFINYGIIINSVSLQGNKYLNFALIQLVSLVGIMFLMYILKNYKRRIPLMFSFFGGALICFGQPFMPKEMSWLSVVCYMISKLMGTFFFSITYIYTSELFPTYTRNSMHAMCSSIGRIGAILAPQTPLLMAYWSGLPTLLFGGASLAAGLVTFLVPDTADNALPDTVREAENIGKTTKAAKQADTLELHEKEPLSS